MMDMLREYLERRTTRKLIRAIPEQVKVHYSGQFLPDYAMGVLKEAVDTLGSDEAQGDLERLMEDLEDRGAEEVALHVAEELDFPYERRRELARKAYRGLRNHVDDHGDNLAMLGITTQDALRQEYELASIAKRYDLGDSRVREHAEEAVNLALSSFMVDEEITEGWARQIRDEFGI